MIRMEMVLRMIRIIVLMLPMLIKKTLMETVKVMFVMKMMMVTEYWMLMTSVLRLQPIQP